MTKPRFEKTSCSQCGREFGPGDSGYSHCADHAQCSTDSILLPRKLTAENGAKAALIGEFYEDFGLLDEDGNEQYVKVAVTWDTIKRVWDAAVAHFENTDRRSPAVCAEEPDDQEMIERVENILRSPKTVSYPAAAAAEYVREAMQELLMAYLKLRGEK